jgi:uncharacterized protein YgbK (DUF1537 family)
MSSPKWGMSRDDRQYVHMKNRMMTHMEAMARWVRDHRWLKDCGRAHYYRFIQRMDEPHEHLKSCLWRRLHGVDKP